MKRKFFATILAALVPLYSAICFAFYPITAQAVSSSPYWEGVDASGAIVKGDSSSIIVENAKINLKVASLPRGGKLELDSYSAEASTEYTFYNPKDSVVPMTLLVPFGEFPAYVTEYAEDTVSSLFLESAQAERSVRYTYSSNTFNADKDVERVIESRKTDAFYRSTASVREYNVMLTAPVDTGDCYVKIKLNYNAKKTRVLFPSGNVRFGISGGDMYAYLVLNIIQRPSVTFYAVGDPIAEMTPTLYYEGDKIAVYANSVRDFQFEELVMMNWSEATGISEVDWYNAFVDMLNEKGGNGSTVDSFMMSPNDLTRWYEYKIIFHAKEHIVGRVTTPLYPAIEGSQNPRYEYTYMLSPVAKWANVQNLEIFIETPYLLSNGSFDFAKEANVTGDGFIYRFTRSSLPQGELTFVLMEENAGDGGFSIFDGSFLWPTLTWAFGALAALTVVSGLVALIIVLTIRNKRKK